MNLDDFRAALITARPFASDRVSKPRLEHPDVPQIHDREFERLIDRIGEAGFEREGRGITILGAAGVGKSHLLGRLHRWANDEPGATAVFLHNLLVSPERLPRYMLASTMGVLTNGRSGDYEDCALYRLWEAAVRRAAHLAPEADITLGVARSAMSTLIESEEPFERAIRTVLLKVGLNMHHALLEDGRHNRPLLEAGLDWLSGEELEPEQVETLGVEGGSNIPEGLRDDQDVEAVFRVLALLSARAGRPFVLCVDQFDNLSEQQVRATTRFLHVLIDHIPNFRCVLSGVTDNVLDLVGHDIISAANWDRVAEERIDLRLVKPEDALEIIRSRVEAFRAPFWSVPELEAPVGSDPLFPLSKQAFDDKVGDAVSVRPRQMIRWARDAWDAEADRCKRLGVAQWLAQWPDGANPTPPPALWDRVVDELIESKREAHFESRLNNPGSLPADAGNQSELVRRLLDVAVAQRRYDLSSVEAGPTGSGLDLLVTRTDGTSVGLAFIVVNRANAATMALKRLCQGKYVPSQLIVVQDERRPIKWGPRGQDYRTELEARGDAFVMRELDLERHAQLDAANAVLLEAKSGDVEVEWNGEMRILSPEDVAEALVRLRALERLPLLAELLGRDASARPPGTSTPAPRGEPTVGGGSTPPPSNGASARHLLGLLATRSEVSIRTAVDVWCRENGWTEHPEPVRDRLEQAGLRLSLLGRVTHCFVEGLLRLRRPGTRPHALAGFVLTWVSLAS